ncbi:uncharacterized protein Bfra_005566 [Botrytis fragariae]|uniref:Small secreted protein n=1 Tax=Botrytis fragariae TaxID=1964551 RepID=A0A8H6ARD1_9HELO|nr:uncharacterized protein Bfra_005566 [Botrytis fragariae]KAF5872212.1 hypothetical protein Bfra_005566 [Botrytis fragariae]
MHPQYTPYLFAVPFLASYPSPVNAVPTNFNLTAITASKNISIFQCWQLTDPIISGEQPGYGSEMILQNLGAMGNATYGYLSANFPGAAHVAPAAQYVVLLSGQMVITISETNQTATFTAGANGIIVAADTQDKSANGHMTASLDEPVATLQIPFLGGVPPGYKVLHDGVCGEDELEFK